MNSIDRRVLFTSGAAAALLAATGVSAQAAPRRGGRLRAAVSGATRSDHWGTADNLFMQAARGAVFENLTEIAGDGTLRGDIAQSWETADGGLTWSFELASDVMFHDGIALNAKDVTAMLQRHERLDVQSVKSLGPRAIKVTLNTANQSLPYTLADPEFAVLPAEPDRQHLGIGSGPYKVHKFQAGQHFIGQRLETHRKDGQAGWFDQVEIVAIPSEAIRAEALRTDLVDVADISALDAYSDPVDFQILPNAKQVQQITRRTIAVPNAIGQTWPLDNARMTTRWWMA